MQVQRKRSVSEDSLYKAWELAKPKLPEECFPRVEIHAKLAEMEKEKAIPIFKKGDRVVLTHVYSRLLGPGSEGIVMEAVYSNYDSVAVDFVRAHNRDGVLNTKPWDGGHSCEGRCKIRNDRYYGHWIEVEYLKKISSVDNEDILLLI